MIIHAISDLHGHDPDLPGGDLLIIAGDLTGQDEFSQYSDFQCWLEKQDYRQKVVVAGNHDVKIESGIDFNFPTLGITYLEDSGIDIHGVKIWGTPHSLTFRGINPNCKAFTGNESQIAKDYALIPADLDILISHGPAFMINDRLSDGRMVGSLSLRQVLDVKRPKAFICGHIHEAAGFTLLKTQGRNIRCYNVSCVDENYKLVRGVTNIKI